MGEWARSQLHGAHVIQHILHFIYLTLCFVPLFQRLCFAVQTPMGIILIDKPLRRTSMDVCANIRARFRRGGSPKRIKVGHAGTLDPLATGLLVIMVGKATTLCNQFMADRKCYLTTIDLSQTSTTDDAEGERIFINNPVIPTTEQLVYTLQTFTGVIMQRPPIYSAMKVGGQRAYDLARQGKPVDLAARPVTIHSLRLVEYAWPLLTLEVHCGKGTYIRSLGKDIGATLQVGGMLTMLRRTSSGDFHVDQARTLDSLPDIMTQNDLTAVSLPIKQTPTSPSTDEQSSDDLAIESDDLDGEGSDQGDESAPS